MVEGLLLEGDAAAVLRCSKRTLYRLVRAGQLPVVKIGRSSRYDPADLRALIERAKGGFSDGRLRAAGQHRDTGPIFETACYVALRPLTIGGPDGHRDLQAGDLLSSEEAEHSGR